MGTGSFPGVKSGRGVTLTPLPLPVPWSRKSRAIPLLPLWAVRPVQSLSACTVQGRTLPFYIYICTLIYKYSSNNGQFVTKGYTVSVYSVVFIWIHLLTWNSSIFTVYVDSLLRASPYWLWVIKRPSIQLNSGLASSGSQIYNRLWHFGYKLQTLDNELVTEVSGQFVHIVQLGIALYVYFKAINCRGRIAFFITIGET